MAVTLFPKNKDCFRNVSVNTWHKGGGGDDDDDGNNNNNNEILQLKVDFPILFLVQNYSRNSTGDIYF